LYQQPVTFWSLYQRYEDEDDDEYEDDVLATRILLAPRF
jgi:hypothetical protein